MGLRLTLLDWWMPKHVIYRELDKVAVKTTDALKEVIKDNTFSQIGGEELHLAGSLEQRRTAMAKLHTDLVQVLVEAVGTEKAIALGREALFKTGKELGNESRRRLGVHNPQDLMKAANILYRVLGIEFKVSWIDKTEAILTVHHCALAKGYSELTCQILSATDEGVINGLVPNATMQFKEKLTGGCSTCIAEITLEEQS
jgi:predicted ArsR family transcriptional regulator